MEIPYNEWELKMALCGVPKEMGDGESEKVKKLLAEIERQVPDSKKELNQKVAEANGITVKDLIDSPNYKVLIQDHLSQATRNLVEEMKKEFNITDIQAWAVIAAGLRLI
ncbi:MAG: hypothetical protein G01um101419_95 [Parcubacteria group bacterium Gr01-1014_19]|nr:MAG: hypothetical protein G01um101419_95 [Parcubacteria group bacterium Gr01-1014_19]